MDSPGVIQGDEYSNGKKYDSMPAYAFLSDSKTVDIVVGYQDNFICTEKEKHENILTVEEAEKIVCEKFSDQNQLNAYKIELVYTMEEVSSESAEYHVQPAWKFSVNDSHGKRMWIYVNAVTNECYYQISKQ